MVKLRALPYVGGKTKGFGARLAKALPYRNGYFEPFAGMLGVLLQRERSKSEIVNDLEGRIVNWWRTVRDHPRELSERLEWTPKHSREEYELALRELDSDPDPVVRAAHFTVVCLNSVERGSCISRMRRSKTGNLAFSWVNGVRDIRSDRIHRLAERLRGVQIENRDAVELLGKAAKRDNIVIYCDPPYGDSGRDHYDVDVDRDSLSRMLLGQQGVCAVSGYGEEWDHLGWHKYVHSFKSSFSDTGGSGSRLVREAVWCNVELLW